MSQIAQITAQADGSFMVNNVVVVGTPSKSLEKTLADGSKSEYCLINCSYKAVDKKTGEIVTRTVAGSRSLTKSMPEKGDNVTLYGRIVEDGRGKALFFSISTTGSNNADALADFEDITDAVIAPKGKLAVNVDM